MKKNYQEEAAKLIQAIDIAIAAVRAHPPKGFEAQHLNRFIESYLEFRTDLVNAEPKHQNLSSLKYSIQEVFTFFQEGSGESVEAFWHEIHRQKLPYTRENKLRKILKRGKIRNGSEHELLLDLLQPYREQGLLSPEELLQLNKMLEDFERKSRRRN